MIKIFSTEDFFQKNRTSIKTAELKMKSPLLDKENTF